MSKEFLIKRTDGKWFDLHSSKFLEILRPATFSSHPIQGWGDHRIEVKGCPIAFSYEDPGIQISFEGDSLGEEEVLLIVTEIAQNITATTGQKSQVIAL